jgi:2-phosphosulfolactate phosphatase
MPPIRQLDVYLLPALVEPEALAGKTVVVIDVLRATTTIIHALAAGATRVVPCLEIEEARNKASEIGTSASARSDRSVVLGGERGGLPIKGFDLGNSPAEYTRERVAGKIVVFTTTNGTRAMQRCSQANRVLIGAFVNFSAVCRELAGEQDIAMICAGTDGHVTREDTLLAGAIVDDLARSGNRQPNDQALLAVDAWHAAVRLMTDRPLGLMLRDSRGGRNLIELGQENDIDLASQMDKFDLVAELDLAQWSIRVA